MNGEESILEADIGGPKVGTDLGGIEGIEDYSFVSIDGTLRLQLAPGYEPPDGTSFPIVRMTNGMVVPRRPDRTSRPRMDFRLEPEPESRDGDVRPSHLGCRPLAHGRRAPAGCQERAVRDAGRGPELGAGTRFRHAIHGHARRRRAATDASAAGPCWGVRIVRCNIDALDPSGNAAIRLVLSARRVGKILTRSSVSALSFDENETNDVIRLRTSIAAA